MRKLLIAVLAVLVMTSVAFAAYPVGHPCLATQKLDALTGVVTSVNPEQNTALAGAVASADPTLKVAAAKDVVVPADASQCPASYFGAQDADRRVAPESGAGSGAGSDG
jgi:hypothetical protein